MEKKSNIWKELETDKERSERKKKDNGNGDHRQLTRDDRSAKKRTTTRSLTLI